MIKVLKGGKHIALLQNRFGRLWRTWIKEKDEGLKSPFQFPLAHRPLVTHIEVMDSESLRAWNAQEIKPTMWHQRDAQGLT